MKPLVDTAARDRIRADLDRSLIVEAAAGTGKTTALVSRIVAVLERGLARVDSLVAVTFTEKAAGELKLRLRGELERARRREGQDPAGRERLDTALARLEEARVGTIHGFCADILRERSVQARVDPQFEVMTDAEARRTYADAFRTWVQRTLDDPPQGVRRSLRRGSKDGPLERLRLAGWTLAEWRDFPTPWRRDEFPREAAIDLLVGELHSFADLTARCAEPRRDNLFHDTERARRASDIIRRTESVRARDHDGAESLLVDLADWKFGRPRKGRGSSYGEGVTRQEVLDRHARLYGALQQFARAADADLAARLQVELRGVLAHYESLKARAGRLDFVDLLVRARDLVRDRVEVREEFQRRFTHVFVDEFQDTDPIQAEILLLLAGDDARVADWRQVRPTPGKLFLVADPKQSIYRFRRADVGIYFEVKRQLEASGAECLQLTTSFRAVPAIQHAVNRAFATAMDGDAESQQAHHVPLSPARDNPQDQPSVVALPVPEPYGVRGGVTKGAIEGCLPDATAAFVQWLIDESGWTVTTREDPRRRVGVEARHVCLLFRRFDSFFAGDITRGYVQALEARGVRHLLVGGRSFHRREEVETLRSALTAIEWPDDELSAYATLRGYLFGFGDEDLLRYRHRYRRLHAFRVPREGLADDLVPLGRALELLAELHRERNRRPVAETIHRLLESTRAHAGFALRPSGEQVLANVLHVAEQARGYERGGGISFRGFVDRLDEEAERGQTGEAPVLEEGSDGVRIMTVHKAKGLEFPVVVLADITANMTPSTAGRTVDVQRGLCAVRIAGWSPVELREREALERSRDAAEGVRLAYVAATRARDLLVVPAVGSEGYGRGWAAPLNEAIYPAPGDWSRREAAPGCPEFGEASVLDRSGSGARETVRPGLHRIGDADHGHDVVWWDPARLPLTAALHYGVRRTGVLDKTVDSSIVERDLEAHERWRTARDDAVARGSLPAMEVQTATQRAAALGAETPAETTDVEVVQLAIDAARPTGARFGAMTHALLSLAPFDAEEVPLRAIAELQRRILGATRDETEAALRVLGDVWKHDLIERARGAWRQGQCRRETPITWVAPDGAVVDGVVDLAFREDAAWTVVDFKTDRDLEPHLATYERQVAIYAAAIAAATGEPASGVLLRV